MKFLHLSDWHITADDAVNEPARQRLEFIGNRYADHYFIISGDIIDNEGDVAPGTPLPVPGGDVRAILPTVLRSPPPPIGPITPHLNRARSALQKAHALLSKLPQGKMIFSSGNHDYGLWGNLYDDEYVRAFDEIIFTKLVPQVPMLVLAPLLQPPRPFSAQYPIVYTITEGPVVVALTVLNSCGNSVLFPQFGTGFIGGEQLDIARPQLGLILPNPFGINQICVLHHHPFIDSDTFMRLNDSGTLLGRLSGNTDLLLFGHKHIERRFEPNQVPNAQLRFGAIAAGSSRVETHAWQIIINSHDSWTISRVPII